MILLDTTDRLTAHLEKMMSQSPEAGIEKMAPEKAYRKGIEDSLTLIRTHIEQCSKATETKNATMAHPTEEKQPQLSQMPPAQVIKLDLNDPKKIEESGFGLTDLIEAAFHFENRLIELLADDNTIPYDAYESLDSRQLGKIIHHCAKKILQLPSTNSGES